MKISIFKTKAQKANQAGFAILEGLVAIVILSIGILAVAGMQNGAVRNNAFAWSVTNQTFDAKQLVENAKPIPYLDNALVDGRDDIVTDKNITTHTVVSENSIYNNTKRITVTTTRIIDNSRPKTIVMDYIRNNM